MSKQIFLLAAVFIAFSQCRPGESSAVESTPYAVTSPLVRDTFNVISYVAEITARQHVDIRSRVSGYMERMHVDEGADVKEGQLLFNIASMQYEMELRKAEAALKNATADMKVAEVELANVRALREKNIVSDVELDVTEAKLQALKADVEEAQANMEQAALNLSFTKIKSPFSGTINRIPRKSGSVISEGDILTSVSDNSEVFAYFNLSEADYLRFLQSGEKDYMRHVNLLLANNTPYPHEGIIEVSESEFDQSTGTIAFRARFPNPDGILKHGSNGKVAMKRRVRNATLVPMKATFELQDKIYLFIVKRDSTLERRAISPLMRIPYYYVLPQGALQGERFLLEGVQRVKPDDEVVPVFHDPVKVLRERMYL